MRSFSGNKSVDNVTTVNDNDEVQLCPSCSFPNYGNARECADCGYPLQDENIRWLRASLVKKCDNPECGHYLCIKDRKCRKCGQSSERTVISPQPAPTDEENYMLVCPRCQTKNPANVSECISCGFSLEDIDPTLSTAEAPVSVQLENVRTRQRATISINPGDTVTIGRQHQLSDQLANTGYVSSEHFIFSYHDGSLWLTDKSRNGTYIDGTRLQTNVEIPIPKGTVVVLGDPSPSELLAACFMITY